MRPLLAIVLFVSSAVVAQAQVQERKLMDRLLKPDMTLQNSEQKKQFTAASAVTTNELSIKSFYVRPRSREKEYPGLQNFGTKSFGTKKSDLAQQKADLSTRTQLPNNQYAAATQTYATRPAVDARKAVEGHAYAASTREFLVRGKSQRFLNSPGKPLTIDEVRDLLNKNK